MCCWRTDLTRIPRLDSFAIKKYLYISKFGRILLLWKLLSILLFCRFTLEVIWEPELLIVVCIISFVVGLFGLVGYAVTCRIYDSITSICFLTTCNCIILLLTLSGFKMENEIFCKPSGKIYITIYVWNDYFFPHRGDTALFKNYSDLQNRK